MNKRTNNISNILESLSFSVKDSKKGVKNTSGGEVLDVLSYGNIKVIYETYWHSFLQKRISIYAGTQLLAIVIHIDNDKALKQCWKEMESYLKEISDNSPKGEASYYYYQNKHEEVKKALVNILNKYKSKLSTKKYDPVSGAVLESMSDGESVKGKDYKELLNNLKSKRLKLDSADDYDIEHSKAFNEEKVVLYDKNDKTYTGLYNRYSDGGREIIHIKKGK